MGSIVHVTACVHYECPEEVLLQRLMKRGQTSGRQDDRLEIIKKRFVTHANSVVPVIEYYKARGKLICICAHKPEAEVLEETVNALKLHQR